MIDLFRTSGEVFLKDPKFGADASDVLLLCAIWVGEAEGRPMTCNKLASYIGMDRNTARRHLEAMAGKRLIKSDGAGLWTADLDADANEERLAQTIDANVQHLARAATAVFKLNNNDLVRR
jgi:DNA-binding IclR family transcriptional regulator